MLENQPERISQRINEGRQRWQDARGNATQPEITFNFEGKDYTVSADAYDANLIVLPDGRLLQPTGWLESIPPIPSFNRNSIIDCITARQIDS